jgi:SpoVK/Ycf46/Vps4 family AAA+-type ATPase
MQSSEGLGDSEDNDTEQDSSSVNEIVPPARDDKPPAKPKFDAPKVKKSRTKKITGAIRATIDYHRDPISKLDKMIGMNEVKNQLQGILSLYQLEQQQKRNGDQIDGSVNHMVFYGNPGTGKTTVARIVADILYAKNMTQTNNFVEVTRQDLIGQYIGHSAPKLNEAVKKAAGGILFIDEAYTLYIPESPNDFGHEIIAELLGVLENNNDNVIVIIAGYEKEIDAFLKSNPGLESRFNTKVHFPDYTVSDLMKIFDTFLSANTLSITPSARELVEKKLAEERQSPTFANARAVRNIFQKCKKLYAMRLESAGKVNDYKSHPITDADVQL